VDRIDAMSVLLAAVDAGSLSACARQRGVPLSTVSRKVSELEAHLKTQLLVRSSRALTLTDAGRNYVAVCRRILEELGEAERAAAGEYSAPRGELVVTAPIQFGRLHVLPVVSAFLEAHPEISIQLVLTDRLVHFVDDHVDVALRIGRLPDSSLVALKLGATRRVVCASPEYLSRNGVPGAPDDLAAHQCVACDALMLPGGWTFNLNGREVEVPVRPRLHVTTSEAAIDAAALGLGLTRVLCYQIAAQRRLGRLNAVLEEFEPEPDPVSLVYAARGMLPLKLRAFLDFSAPRIRAALAQAQDCWPKPQSAS
jgi:DNA-binding transcriptional LysR family regulator